MVSDVQTLNDYGYLISSYVRRAREQVLADRENLSLIVTELKALFGKVAGSAEAIEPAVFDPAIVERALTEEDAGKLLRSIDDIRLRMIGVLLGAGELQTRAGSALDVHLTRELVTEPAGLTWGVMNRRCVILLPGIDERRDPSDVARDFLSVYEETTRVDGWVIDCSAVKRFPLMLLAVILGYQDCLADIGKKLKLVWLAQSAVPDELFGRVERLFELQQIGDFFFTKGLKR